MTAGTEKKYFKSASLVTINEHVSTCCSSFIALVLEK